MIEIASAEMRGQPCAICRDLPTQVEAANAFREFVEALDSADRISEKLQPILKDLLRHFFNMASTVEAMDVIMTVDTIVERLGEGVQPYAVDCCREVRFCATPQRSMPPSRCRVQQEWYSAHCTLLAVQLLKVCPRQGAGQCCVEQRAK
jgi:hypothetical protein